MENIENKLQEIQKYFIDKILNEEYIVLERKSTDFKLEIDHKHIINLWICYGEKGLSTYSNSVLRLDFSDEQKKTIWENLQTEILEFEKEEKLAMFEKLKAELKKWEI